MTAVSVVITTQDEELNVGRCLESVAGWADQTVVVDSGSTDRTLEICRAHGAEIVAHPYVDHASQWAWALRNAGIRNEWVLALDADNLVSDKLKREIDEVVAAGPEADSGYYVRHTHLFRNRRVRGLKARWLRLVRLDRVGVDESELVDVRFVVDGRVGSLSGEIVESNQKELSIDFWLEKHRKFAARMAAEEVLRRAGNLERSVQPRLFGAGSEQRMVWLKERWDHLPLNIRPFLYFAYRYFFRLGFLDGLNGLAYHTLQALWFRLLIDIKIAELDQQLAAGDLSLDELRASVRPCPSGAGGSTSVASAA